MPYGTMTKVPLRTRILQGQVNTWTCMVYLHFVFRTLHREVGHLNDVVHLRDLSQSIEEGGLDYHNEGLAWGIQGLYFQPIVIY